MHDFQGFVRPQHDPGATPASCRGGSVSLRLMAQDSCLYRVEIHPRLSYTEVESTELLLLAKY